MQFIDIKPSCNQLQTFSNGFTSFARPLGANYSAIILEEVALEGLDGITKSMLNYRLKNRRGFQPNLNDGFLLEILCHHVQKGRISIFKLDNDRSFVLPYDRYVNVDPEGIIIGNIIFYTLWKKIRLKSTFLRYYRKEWVYQKQSHFR